VHDNAEPRIDIMYHTPGYPNDDLYALDVVEGILSDRSGRLYHRLITKENLCVDAGASNAVRLQDGNFQVWAVLKKDINPAQVETVLLDEIKNLMQSPPSAKEMQRIKNSIRMSFMSNLKSLEGLSDRLAWFQRLGSWKGLLEYPDKIIAVKAEQIPGIVTKYFSPDTKVIGLLLPQKAQKSPSAQPVSPSPRKGQ
jgi:zinc protease